MRISNLGFARILDPLGRNYALLINDSQLRRGVRVLSPIGGGLHATPAGKRVLESMGAYDFLHDGTSCELRFQAPAGRVSSIVEWLLCREQRERSVGRELVEELVMEAKVLAYLTLAYEEKFSHSRTFIGDSPRPGLTDPRTHYVVDVYDIRLADAAMQTLCAAAAIPRDQRMVHFVSPQEILAGRTEYGVKIGKTSPLLLQ